MFGGDEIPTCHEQKVTVGNILTHDGDITMNLAEVVAAVHS
jgi:hypothetical protein